MAAGPNAAPAHGGPELFFCAVAVTVSRGPKLATTKEVALTPELKESGGSVVIPGQLSFVATLFASKTGKTTGVRSSGPTTHEPDHTRTLSEQ